MLGTCAMGKYHCRMVEDPLSAQYNLLSFVTSNIHGNSKLYDVALFVRQHKDAMSDAHSKKM